ncbi:PadR family transcriptional regulator [Actinomadura kijaniata]|uniref:PadR family transcriptional regulator n=1 Tax=Actinomadura kijaniata TaxID=46161 RepID=UPI003F1C7077
MQDVVLALLAKEPSHGYELRARLQAALGPLGDELNAGQVYVTLRRLEKAGLVDVRVVGQSDRPDRKVYDLTPAGRDRAAAWLTDLSWERTAPTEFHLKLTAAAASGMADPVALVDAQRRALLRRLAEVRRAAFDQPPGSAAALLLEGASLRLEADLRWLESCAAHWTNRTDEE